jgi:hypothetical protein
MVYTFPPVTLNALTDWVPGVFPGEDPLNTNFGGTFPSAIQTVRSFGFASG